MNDQITKRLCTALPEDSCIFLYGSRVYGTHHETSDHDFQIIVPDKIYNHGWKNKLEDYQTDVHDWPLMDSP